MNFEESQCASKLRGISDRLREGHLYNALYMTTELQQDILREIGKIRHGEQDDASWLVRPSQPPAQKEQPK